MTDLEHHLTIQGSALSGRMSARFFVDTAMIRKTSKDLAKQIIVEIIRQSGGEFHNKTNLFKAFWLSHLCFSKNTGRILSSWPIVRMPRGPGIDRHQLLIGELVRDGILLIDQVDKGGFDAFVFKLSENSTVHEFSDVEKQAISDALRLVDGKTAAQVSEESHKNSKAWNNARDGEEMNLYLDIIPQEDRQFLETEAAELAEIARGLIRA